MQRGGSILVWAVLAACVLAPQPARADAIDGNWCHEDGRTMTIDGPAITIPSGKQIVGDYDRHGFSYVIPDDEPGGGARIDMALLNEETVRLNRGVPPGSTAEPEPEIWRRCKPVA